MPVTSINFIKFPPPSHKTTSKACVRLPEWTDTLIKIQEGLPPQQYLCVEFSKETLDRFGKKNKDGEPEGYKLPVNFRNCLAAYVKTGGLQLDVYMRDDKVYIVGR